MQKVIRYLGICFVVGALFVLSNCKTNIDINDDGMGGAIRTTRTSYYLFYTTGVEHCKGVNGMAVCAPYTVNH
jgi:hypothetical protein